MKNHKTNDHERPVVGLGQACLDFLGLVPAFPRVDDKCRMSELDIQGGGPTATALAALSRLGVGTALIGAVGQDDFGRSIRQSLVEDGVDVARLRTVPGTSQAAFVVVDPKAQTRTIFWHPGSIGDYPLEDDDISLIRRARLLHLDGLHLGPSLAAAREARNAGTPVVYDAGTLRPGSLDLAALTDCLIVSEKFMRVYQPDGHWEEGLRRLRELGPGRTAVTLGPAGSLGLDDGGLYRQAAWPVEVVDTTGAGDVFHGAYIYGLLAGWDMAGCLDFAAAVAALKCRCLGGRAGLPDLETVRGFMGDRFPG